MRIYEFAKQNGLSNKQLLEMLAQHGQAAQSHMSVLNEKQIDILAKLLKQDNQKKSDQESAHKKQEPAAQVSQKSTSPEPKQAIPAKKEVVHKNMQNDRQKAFVAKKEHKRTHERTEQPSPKQVQTEDEAVQQAPVSIVVEAMTVADFAQRTNMALSDVILTLLKQGVVSSKNQMLSRDIVDKLARKYGFSIIVPESKATTEAKRGAVKTAVGKEQRPPVVVVMGHVDHGKTTLLDTIRKTRVAAREKGGITQHLGAYAVMTPQGMITFLDTPGHEAFFMIRARGVRVADIAILVVAADDGVKPQTLEALRIAQETEIPIIVAINKIDRATPAQIERVKQELSQRGLVPEEWGGQTMIVPLSAKLGEGIDTLLELISLQAQVMELTTNTQEPVIGVVVESRMAKGLGYVGTVISRQGILRVGDYFTAGGTEGRVTALIDEQGKRLHAVSPSFPVCVAGFYALPRAGDVFAVVPILEDRKRQGAGGVAVDRHRAILGEEKDIIRLVLKADTASSLEALIGSVQNIAQKVDRNIHIIQQGVGPISEREIIFAAETGALIYGLHVRLDAGAAGLAQRREVVVHLFDIIYALLDDVAARLKKEKIVEKVAKKIGEASVLKVFDIKKMGIVAGAQVKNGIFSRDGSVKIYRGKQLVGEGTIKSLQRDRKAVKEVHSGFECAFMVAGFDEWEVGDRVECYLA
jgi:translation initiation factor IF-2